MKRSEANIPDDLHGLKTIPTVLLGGGFKYFSFSLLFGDDSQFDIFQRG